MNKHELANPKHTWKNGIIQGNKIQLFRSFHWIGGNGNKIQAKSTLSNFSLDGWMGMEINMVWVAKQKYMDNK